MITFCPPIDILPVMSVAGSGNKFMRYFLIALFILLSACSKEDVSKPISSFGESKVWRVSISLPDIDLPVSLYIAHDSSEAWFANGAERVQVPEIKHEGKTWTLRFPTFNNTMVLEETETGLKGSLTLIKRGYEQIMPLEAEPDAGFRFTKDAQALVDFTGRWEVGFTDDEGKESIGVGEFDQQGATVSGTFLTPLGDYRYLAGEVDGNVMRLSTFDGAHAFVFTATMLTDGTLVGDFWSGTSWHEAWVASRNFEARLPDAYALTYLKEGFDRLEFSFPDLDGLPVTLDDEQFRNKVVLVNLSGTWCPNCADEMEFLSKVYKEHREQGLEIVTLLFEHFEDFTLAAQQGKALVAKHDIDFNVLVAGSSDKDAASKTLPMLNHVLAFPTLIFVDRTGKVRKIHTGFSGPGTGQHYDDFKIAFSQNLEGLLDEEVPEGP
ncbi:MAG: thiol-disulfide isomerase/thioredoxin [Rhodothermales bacterium]